MNFRKENSKDLTGFENGNGVNTPSVVLKIPFHGNQ